MTSCNKNNRSKNTTVKEGYYFRGDVAGKPVKYEVDSLSITYRSAPFAAISTAPSNYIYEEGTYIGETADNRKNNIIVATVKHFDHNSIQISNGTSRGIVFNN
jgi:hypothetical protein